VVKYCNENDKDEVKKRRNRLTVKREQKYEMNKRDRRMKGRDWE
jgi:hypothetical protein